MNAVRYFVGISIVAAAAACGAQPAAPTMVVTHAPATASPMATVSATPTVTLSPEPSVEAQVTTLGPGQEALDSGVYRIDLDKIPSGGDGLPALLVNLDEGWQNLNGWAIHKGALDSPTVAIQFWDVGEIYGHPCDWQGTLFYPGPGTDDLAQALAGRPMRNATTPSEVTVSGYSGKYLEWSVPGDLEFSECDADGATHYFESWSGRVDGDRYQQGPGQIDRLWVLDVDGIRLVIDAFEMPAANADERQELTAVIESITFQR